MAPVRTIKNILMELRKICQHPYLTEPELESFDIPEMEQHKQLIEASGKLMFLKLLLPKLKERGHRVLLFSQFKIALDRIEDFLYGENVKFLRLDGDVQQAQRQKFMDLFNAPNSEYDVFLLTTRAGGVGINLATADTVILFDPDFNPHQDLQAIARSHRYGQKKKVLVFKLMVKGSVEENIINKGKKKMVLDHLVVQQMGKESEEGDIDDLLLRGVEAVYSNQGGMNIPDIVYNSKNVDELIDKVEADAEAEAKEMEEREKAIADGTVESSKIKSNQQFGFAKIWEADQNQLQNIADENQDDGDGREINWEYIIDAMEKERQEKLQQMMKDQTKKKRKAATNVNNVDLSFLSDGDTPTKNNKHKKGKGKGKGILDGSSDYDGKGSNAESEDSEYNEFPDSNMPSELRGLGLDQILGRGESNIPSVPGPSNNPLTIPLSLPHPTLPGLGDNIHPPPHTGPSKRPRDKEDKEARKRRRLEQKQAELFRKSQQAVNGIVHPPNNHYHQVTPAQQVKQHILEQRYAEARQVLNLMYHILREFGNEKNIRRWALIALPELPPEERVERYRVLAEEVDTHLSSMNQTQYFSLPEQIRTVSLLLVSRGEVVVNGDMAVPNIPPNVGLVVPPRNVAAPVAPAPRIRRKGDDMSNGTTPDPGSVAGPSTHTAILQAQPHDRPTHPQAPNLSESLLNNLMDSAPPSCQFCSGPHDLRECDNLSSVEDIQAISKAIMESNDSAPDKTIALKTLERTRSFLIKAGRLPNGMARAQNLAVPSSSHNNLTPSNLIAPSDSTNGHAVTPVKTPKPKTKASSAKKTPKNTHEVIEIPDSPPLTPAITARCPFCEKSCGLPIRDCVERNGGRKALKVKIRLCEERIQGGDGSRGIREGQQLLYECYKSWPREKK
ncbi:hypothetical protein I302_106887 [Kwoniella bestiolae CBS 10118]|uniref:Helicase C-terminal domain-containing protein n=1 Tax=Kwoniella bestiolae CBS 10118 TaxID=1296100 RepID=A0A1B9G046_9TREE|nr:hypothetical protein I302_05847 [Kwoniella bestiolae CBS 10118]OCF24387.1 hypothetical protein I302_05847 [Kwoniella bestiolae CBS 10118]